MDLNQLRELLDLVREHELSEFEIEHDGLRVKVRKNGSGGHAVQAETATAPPAAQPQAAATTGVAPLAAATGPAAVGGEAAADSEIELAVVKSPIVGTFYRSPEPGAASFVDVGVPVKKGQ